MPCRLFFRSPQHDPHVIKSLSIYCELGAAKYGLNIPGMRGMLSPFSKTPIAFIIQRILISYGSPYDEL